ncbi:MAG: S41 family peptidase [Gaiellaceae bacterium]
MTVVLPSLDPTLSGQLPLLELERAGFEAELGAPVEFTTSDPGRGSRWLLVLDPEHRSAPVTSWQTGAETIVSRAKDVDGIFEALNLWRTVRRDGGTVSATDCATREEAIDRVVAEVADTYPAFELRGLDWEGICARHATDVRRSEDALAAFQAWLAELEDSHTWVWPGHGNLPYVLYVDTGAAYFTHVPRESAGFAAGVRPGWRLLGLDDRLLDGPDWLARTAAPPHSRPYLAGRRLLAGPAGVSRLLRAVDADGRRVSWEEAPTARPPEPIVEWRRLPSGLGYLRIAAWLDGVEEAVDAAFDELRGGAKLILDLRRNPGGSLVLAARTRDRFLRTETDLGSIRYSIGAGRLSPPTPLRAEPASDSCRWPGRLTVLTDALTFSSSEDFLLGLQGLEHVSIVGSRSGGGSGRPRTIRLRPGWLLTVSTALTYDRNGHCVEAAGIPVDAHVPAFWTDVDNVLEAAERL